MRRSRSRSARSLAGYVFMHRSFMGFQMQVAGQAEAAARYAGFSAKRTIWTGLLVGGAMAGIAGMGEVAGPMGQLTEHVSNNYGFAAIIVAFVGRLNPIGIFFASLLMALLYLGGEQAQQYLNLPSSISKVFQGMLLFFLLGADVFVNYRLRWSGGKTLAVDSIFTAILVATIVAGTPLIITALGELVTEKSGVLNLGAEGMMAVGAIAGFAAAHHTGSATLGTLAGMVAGALMALIFAILTLTLLANQVASGLALSIFGVGLSAFIGKPYESVTLPAVPTLPIPLLADIPVIGPGALQSAGARLRLVGAARRPSSGSCIAAGPVSCCARSANRRRRRTRSAIRSSGSAISPRCSAARWPAWAARFFRCSTRRSGSRGWWRAAAGSRSRSSCSRPGGRCACWSARICSAAS